MKPGLGLVGAHLRLAGLAPRRTARSRRRTAPSPGRRPASRDTAPRRAATTPASSWPGTCGSATGSWPFQACQSERQTPVARTETTTPSAGQSGSGSSLTTGSAPCSS